MRVVKIALIFLLLAGCGGSGESAEETLRRWVAEAQSAAEAKDRGALMEMVSGHYADARGNDHQAIDQMLRYIFLRQDSVMLITRIDEITISADSAALVKLSVGMAGANDRRLGFSADAYRFELEMEHDGDDWLLIAARWADFAQDPH